MSKRTGIATEFWLFVIQNKAYWLVPILKVGMVLAGMIALASISPAVAPFIYTLF